MGVEEKIMVVDGGRYEMVVNSSFEDMEGRVGLTRVWEFVPEVGKKRNERVNLSRNSSFWQMGLLADLERHAEMWGVGDDRAWTKYRGQGRRGDVRRQKDQGTCLR